MITAIVITSLIFYFIIQFQIDYNFIHKLINGDELTEEEKDILKRDVIYKIFSTNHKVEISKIIPESKAKGKIAFEETIFITFIAKLYLCQKKIFYKQLSRAEEWLEKGIEKKTKRSIQIYQRG